MVGHGMTRERLDRMAEVVRAGAVGGVRRRHRAARRPVAVDDTKVQQSVKKLGVAPIGEIEQVEMVMVDGVVVQFEAPSVQACVHNNIYVISGRPVVHRPEGLAIKSRNRAELRSPSGDRPPQQTVPPLPLGNLSASSPGSRTAASPPLHARWAPTVSDSIGHLTEEDGNDEWDDDDYFGELPMGSARDVFTPPPSDNYSVASDCFSPRG